MFVDSKQAELLLQYYGKIKTYYFIQIYKHK